MRLVALMFAAILVAVFATAAPWSGNRWPDTSGASAGPGGTAAAERPVFWDLRHSNFTGDGLCPMFQSNLNQDTICTDQRTRWKTGVEVELTRIEVFIEHNGGAGEGCDFVLVNNGSDVTLDTTPTYGELGDADANLNAAGDVHSATVTAGGTVPAGGYIQVRFDDNTLACAATPACTCATIPTTQDTNIIVYGR